MPNAKLLPKHGHLSPAMIQIKFLDKILMKMLQLFLHVDLCVIDFAPETDAGHVCFLSFSGVIHFGIVESLCIMCVG